jgi:hypothetical protein
MQNETSVVRLIQNFRQAHDKPALVYFNSFYKINFHDFFEQIM